ncbi:GAP family protein [Faecalicatena contorta]|uniref:Sap, sulfolipid-1-addressing protein n=1 Tax=Faecalicatena contorta TaxID=39482 RepID=A0A315ZNI5_9FIRM|nr:GAP family protein [Faecalicatena contorta]PWJ46819.1 Sap-like sulfolipid-1-addressing protein [Faecalicatena contorta]SUQ16327.1 Sap, sulfolipid-1-addressing protein [Faecalicatena contorta]
MWGLLFSTVLTSAADSLNPIAITQQFVLQGMVKKPKHILYFIIPTGVTNLIGGFLAYFGLITFIGSFFSELIERHWQILLISELILGIVFLIGVGFLLQSKKLESFKKQIQSLKAGESYDNKDDEAEAVNKIKSVSPMALMVLGVGATISELTTALPYFAFLAILFNYQLTFLQVAFILVVYNIIYTSPLIILYFIYIRAQDKFDHLYQVIKTQVTKLSNVLVPTLVSIIGVVLVYHALSLLLL